MSMDPETPPVLVIRDPERPLHLKSRPLLRIGLAQGLQKIDFKVNGPFRLENLDGHTVHASNGSELRWRARCQQTQSAQYHTSVLVDSFHHEPQALALARRLLDQGYDAWIRCIGMPVHFENGVQHNALRFRVLVGRFENESQAADVQTLLNNDWRPRLVREKTAEPTGR
ncbi:MAG: SPOR domain-containing protein, partial [Candidatus Cloacimonetes bacterium]|nr:SPOR domain-containing protein [Candidatus Cloacimonadota bacterium]